MTVEGLADELDVASTGVLPKVVPGANVFRAPKATILLVGEPRDEELHQRINASCFALNQCAVFGCKADQVLGRVKPDTPATIEQQIDNLVADFSA